MSPWICPPEKFPSLIFTGVKTRGNPKRFQLFPKFYEIAEQALYPQILIINHF